MADEPDDGRILRAKYLDWCSARVAERFLQLTPDEIYRVAHEGASGAGDDSPVGVELSYRTLVERVTEALTARMELPTYEEWSAAYAESPERFEAELSGLWRERL
ncbi:MAG TPA: hypothetical protein VFQ38_23060 [Longimicrobiales bacterium]|nr:hypothetical protein [Longimicrobiales bacterium]